MKRQLDDQFIGWIHEGLNAPIKKAIQTDVYNCFLVWINKGKMVFKLDEHLQNYEKHRAHVQGFLIDMLGKDENDE